jgi:hypothetical protein
MQDRQFRTHFARPILEVLAERHGQDYAEEKADGLASLDPAHVLLWCNNLDQKNQASSADRLGLSLAEF